jgi:hypothetical protein
MQAAGMGCYPSDWLPRFRDPGLAPRQATSGSARNFSLRSTNAAYAWFVGTGLLG